MMTPPSNQICLSNATNTAICQIDSVTDYAHRKSRVISTMRSCIHLLAPDGGAESIAGLDLSVAGAAGIIFAFALWGSSQLLFALIQLLVVFRYRALVPLMYLMLILEVLLRELVGAMKPVTFAHTPPGAIGNQVVLPLAILMLVLSLWSAQRQAQTVK
jgi:hypothetical protein